MFYTQDFFLLLYLLGITTTVGLITLKVCFPQSFFRYKKFSYFFSHAFVLFLILLIGFRPIGKDGCNDTPMYMEWFSNVNIYNFTEIKDKGFGFLTYLISLFFSIRGFFVLISFFSIGLLYFVSTKVAKEKWFLFFICYSASLYYWNNNAYYIRQGLASILFISALFNKKRTLQVLIILIAVSFHKALLLPFFAYMLSLFYKNTYSYLFLWVISIPISFFSGHFWELLFSNLINDPRTEYFTVNNPSHFLYFRSGFRWDMILYSFIFVLVGAYNLVNKKSDEYYQKIFNIFLISNAIFNLIILTNHSFRFAYLSWFLNPLIIFYPFFTSKDFKYKSYIIALVIFQLFLLSYYISKINYQ